MCLCQADYDAGPGSLNVRVMEDSGDGTLKGTRLQTESELIDRLEACFPAFGRPLLQHAIRQLTDRAV